MPYKIACCFRFWVSLVCSVVCKFLLFVYSTVWLWFMIRVCVVLFSDKLKNCACFCNFRKMGIFGR